MAQQIAGLCFLEGTFDQLTFYKMDGKYYCRIKSSLTSERVKNSPEFAWTMALAWLMGRASKIGSQIYQALPESWRQFWMYRSFTGEAFILLKDSAMTDEEVIQILWKTYVEYWEQWDTANKSNPVLQIIKAPKQKHIRKRRVYNLESTYRQMIRRAKDKKDRRYWLHQLEQEQKRQQQEKLKARHERFHKRMQRRALQQARQERKAQRALRQIFQQEAVIHKAPLLPTPVEQPLQKLPSNIPLGTTISRLPSSAA